MLIRQQQVGIFNCVNSGAASRFDYVQLIMQMAGIPINVLPSQASSFKRKAQVSANESAQNLKLSLSGYTPMRSWQDALAEYINNDLRQWIYEQKQIQK